MSRLSIVIPVFNEAATVGELLERVWSAPVPTDEKELIIVESNSSDKTRDIVKEFIAQKRESGNPRIKLILQEKPRGKGHAVREGFKSVTGDIILIQDGDLEYCVEDYPSLIEPILSRKTDFVLGSRHLSSGSWKIRKFESSPWKSVLLNFGGVLFHGFFNLLYGQRLTDPTTMYKVFSKRCLNGMDLISDRFEFDFEILGKLILSGYAPLEVPVSYVSRGFKEGKKVRVLQDPLRWIWAIVKFRFYRFGDSVKALGRLSTFSKPVQR